MKGALILSLVFLPFLGAGQIASTQTVESRSEKVEHSFSAKKYICTTGADSVYTGDFVISLTDKFFKVTEGGKTILLKRIDSHYDNKFYFAGGYVRLALSLDASVCGFFLHHTACKRVFYYHKGWGEKKTP